MTYTPCGCDGWRWFMGPLADSGAFDLIPLKDGGSVNSIPVFTADGESILIHFCPFCGKQVWAETVPAKNKGVRV